jgi:heme-degrading monooxygenase HmoA
MIRAVLTMKVKEGAGAAFEQAWRDVAEHTRQVPGNLRQTLLVDQNQPDVFVITSDWEDRESFRRYERSDEQDVLTAPLRAMRESAHMSIQTLVMHVEA